MSFKYSVIGDNTIENIEYLEKLGYKPNYVYDKEGILYTRNDILNYYVGFIENIKHECVNCIGNPQLFQAVSAMRDDSDYMQFFVSKGWRDYYDDPIPDKWVLCTSNTLEEFGNVNNSPNSYSIPSFGWRKATLSELQANFQSV